MGIRADIWTPFEVLQVELMTEDRNTLIRGTRYADLFGAEISPLSGDRVREGTWALLSRGSRRLGFMGILVQKGT